MSWLRAINVLKIPLMWRLQGTVCAVWAALFLTTASRGGEFVPLGSLPSGGFGSRAFGISDDGAVVTGESLILDGREAFRWTAETGMVGLGFLDDDDVFSAGSAASADGQVIVGGVTGENTDEAWIWTQSQGMRSLGGGGGGFAWSNDISSDGSVVVGLDTPTDAVFEGFRWTEAEGVVGIGDLSGGTFSSTANAVSGDGTVIVGASSSEFGVLNEAYRWTQEGGMVGLGDLPGGDIFSMAWGVSDDGKVIVGEGDSDQGQEAFRWTEETGMVGLGNLPGGTSNSEALAVSGDGSLVVGRSDFDGFLGFGFAFIWDETHGMRELQQVLADDHGLAEALEGWILTKAFDITPDGRYIIGEGINPQGNIEAWRAMLAPVPIPGDINRDGSVNLADFVLLKEQFGQTGPGLPADIDADGSVGLGDFVILKDNFGSVGIAVPEPSALLLLLCGAIWLLFSASGRRCV